jgi:hypothetical protein
MSSMNGGTIVDTNVLAYVNYIDFKRESGAPIHNIGAKKNVQPFEAQGKQAEPLQQLAVARLFTVIPAL